MGIIYNGPGKRNNLSDPFNNYNGMIGIELRGSSSQYFFPKKQYGIELVDGAGQDIDTVLLGMPAEEDWVLFAPYNDKSLMRDVLAYKMGRDLGRYAPRTRYCELVLNGLYNGVYVLIEKVKRNKNRVDVNKLDPDEITGDDVTGGYIIKIDKGTGGFESGWTSAFTAPSSNKMINFLHHYPEESELAVEQKTYIKNFINDFEVALNGVDFKDPVVGYQKYIDVNSFIDFFIMNEVSKNVDGYRISTFLHKQRESDGGKLVMGPIWDFNLGFGNADYCTSGNPEGLVLEFNSMCPGDGLSIPFWWYRLLEDPTFTKKLSERWAFLRSEKFRTDVIFNFIDSTAAVLDAEAAQRNFQRWPVLNTYVWPNYFVGASFDIEIEWLKDWVARRMLWLDSTIAAMATSVDESQSKSAVTLNSFPNPFIDKLVIQYSIEQPGKVFLDLYDEIGRVKESVNVIHQKQGAFAYEFNSSFPSGIYYCVIKLNDEYASIKVVKY